MIQSAVQGIGSVFKTVFNSAAIVVNTTILAITKQFEWAIDGMATALDALPDSIVPDGWVDGLNEAGQELEDFNNGAILGLEELGQEIINTWSGEETKKAASDFNSIVKNKIIAPLKEAKEEIISLDNGMIEAPDIVEDTELSERQKYAEAYNSAYLAGVQARENAEIASIEEISAKQAEADAKRQASFIALGNTLQSTFKTAFDRTISDGENLFSALADSFKKMFIDQVTSMLAGLAVKGLLGGLTGGAGNVGGSLLGDLLGFATGTNYAPGGMAMVHERGQEVINLPQGSQVQPSYANNTTNNYNPTFNVYQQPGEDSQALARRLNDLSRQGFTNSGMQSYAFAGAQ